VAKVAIEVRKGAARFDVVVRARSMTRALSLVEGWYPGGEYRVRIPIDHPQSLFAEDLVAQAGMGGMLQLSRVAA
jgi:hypothetical protein